MNKETIEIERHKKHISGYGKLSYLDENSDEILNNLIKWSRTKMEKDIKQIYKHKVRYVEENRGKDGVYEFRSNNCPPVDIPYCDLVCYLDIYYQ